MKKQVSKKRNLTAAICATAGGVLSLLAMDFGRKDVVTALRMLAALLFCISTVILWKDYLKMRQEEQNHDGQY